MRVRFAAALAGVAFGVSAAAGAAQTTTAPTSAPAIGPTRAPVLVPVGGAAPSTASTYAPAGMPMTHPGGNRMPMPAGGQLALDVRNLRGTRTGAGFRITGQALAKDACTAARFTQFVGNIFPPRFNVVQYRRPGTLGLLCAPHPTWVTIQPLTVASAAPPRYVTVHAHKGSTRVPILPGPVY